MRTLKIITTVLIVLLMFIILFFAKGLSWNRKKDKASIIGFGFMQIVYALSLICIWF